MKNHELFKNVVNDKDCFEELLNNIEILKFSKFEVIFKIGEEAKNIFIVIDGEVQLKIINNLTKITKIIGIQRSGEIFGEVSCLTGEKHSSNAIVNLDSTIILIPFTYFKKLLSSFPEMYEFMLKLVANRLKFNYKKFRQTIKFY